ncbi:UDP-glycosyltransferase 73C7 [Linum perenne]
MPVTKETKGTGAQMLKADSEAYGVIMNSFQELEDKYIAELKKDELDKLQRGGGGGAGREIVDWLDSKDPNSVIYVCFGNWIVESGFEDRISERGLLIRGWAPQMLILSHPAVGGFMTHFEELRVGVEVGVKRPMMENWKEVTIDVVPKEDVAKAVETVMDGGEQGEERRRRAIEVAKMAKRAVENGGSSQENITELIEDIKKYHLSEQVERAVRLAMDVGEEGEERRKRAKELAEMARRAVDTGGSSWRNIGMLIDDVGQWHQQRMEKLEGDSLER